MDLQKGATDQESHRTLFPMHHDLPLDCFYGSWSRVAPCLMDKLKLVLLPVAGDCLFLTKEKILFSGLEPHF